jgi:nucleoside-diphosphate-sugar epimerase
MDIGTGESISVNNLAQIMMNILGRKVIVNHVERKAGVEESLADTKLATKYLKFQAKTSIYDGLEKMINGK